MSIHSEVHGITLNLEKEHERKIRWEHHEGYVLSVRKEATLNGSHESKLCPLNNLLFWYNKSDKIN